MNPTRRHLLNVLLTLLLAAPAGTLVFAGCGKDEAASAIALKDPAPSSADTGDSGDDGGDEGARGEQPEKKPTTAKDRRAIAKATPKRPALKSSANDVRAELAERAAAAAKATPEAKPADRPEPSTPPQVPPTMNGIAAKPMPPVLPTGAVPVPPTARRSAPAALAPKPAGGLADRPDVPPLPIDKYLAAGEIGEIIGAKGLVERGPLAGMAPGAAYNSVVFGPGPKSKAKGFGVALQVWQERTRRDVNGRYRRMKRQYPNSTETTALTGTKAFFSNFDTIMSFSFMDYAKRLIVSISCDTDTCTPEQLFKLAQAAKNRL